MIGSLFYWTGAIVWACVGSALVWILIEVVIGFCCAVSFFRWALAVGRNQGVKMLNKPIKGFFVCWIEHIGYRNNGSENVWWPGGYWRGIGDSFSYPGKKETKHSNSGD